MQSFFARFALMVSVTNNFYYLYRLIYLIIIFVLCPMYQKVPAHKLGNTTRAKFLLRDSMFGQAYQSVGYREMCTMVKHTSV